MKLEKLKIKSFVTQLSAKESLGLRGGQDPLLDTLDQGGCIQIQMTETDGLEGDPHELGGGFRKTEVPA